MLEPVFTIILTAVLLRGFMNGFQLAGGVVVLAGAAMTVLMQKNKPKNDMEEDTAVEHKV